MKNRQLYRPGQCEYYFSNSGYIKICLFQPGAEENGVNGVFYQSCIDTRLQKSKRSHKRFQHFRQSCVLSIGRIEIQQLQPLVWIALRSGDNMYDWPKILETFDLCFHSWSRVSMQTVTRSAPLTLCKTSNGKVKNWFSLQVFGKKDWAKPVKQVVCSPLTHLFCLCEDR